MNYSQDILRGRLSTLGATTAVIFAVLLAFSGCKQDNNKKDPPPDNGQKSATEKRVEEIEKKIGEISKETDDSSKLIEYCEGLYEDPNPQVTELVAGLMVNINVKQLQAGAPNATKHLKRAVDVLIDREAVGPLHLALAQEAAGWIERDNQIELAKSLWKKIDDKFSKHENPEIAEQARDVVDRAHRRTGMLGSELELSGSLVRGGELDWSKYRGKVVLVDFWATWCPPCVAEMPHLKRLYDKYQEQGFVILGISLDSDETDGTATTMTAKDKVLQFFNDRDLPWDSVYFADAKHQGWENPIARQVRHRRPPPRRARRPRRQSDCV